MISYVSKAQSVVEELKTYMQADTLEEIKNKCDNLLKMLVLQGMHPDYEQYRRQILTSQELPSMENLFIRLLQAPFPKPGGNSTDDIQSSAIGSNQDNREGHGGGGCPQRSRCNRMRFTQDACDSLPGLPEETERLKKEQEEKEHKKKEKAEAHLYTIIKVARDEDLSGQIGKDIYFDLVDHDKVRSFCVQKQTSFNLFKEEVAKEFNIPVQFQRFWLWSKRKNCTYRPYQPLTPVEEAQSVGQLGEVSNKVHNAELKLFLEVELWLDLLPIAPPHKTKDDILLFFKLYDPEKEELRYVGRLFVKNTGKPLEILMKLNKMAGYDPYEEIGLYEEIKFEPNVMCLPIDKKLTFRASQLQDGDIICFQKAPAKEHVRYPGVPSYLEYVHNRLVVHFRSLHKPKEDDFCLEMSRLYKYDDVVERVAQQLGLDDPSIIRLTPHNCYSQQPKPKPVKYRCVEHLSENQMLFHCDQTSDILYYEVLDIGHIVL
ncbi:ubiquitin C-terminal hydrolase 13-like isoform X2 [Vigna umbellata]|uniref:ubiquitin C-terminal hydrolase 13-like isoform X2 n=1 Tax=Vigna umbellata TaxID=87088 RepID=UPI001F5EC78A|nr:ubiquitin C-terminal hydrolase 13-like isoform X2 [Vigna umbellata]